MRSASALWIYYSFSALRLGSYAVYHYISLSFYFIFKLSPMNALLVFQVRHASRNIFCHSDQHLGLQVVALCAQKG